MIAGGVVINNLLDVADNDDDVVNCNGGDFESLKNEEPTEDESDELDDVHIP